MNELREALENVLEIGCWQAVPGTEDWKCRWCQMIKNDDPTTNAPHHEDCAYMVARAALAAPAVAETGMLEVAAQACEKRAHRSSSARGGMGQILADTQDEEARQCAIAIRAMAAQAPKPSTGTPLTAKDVSQCLVWQGHDDIDFDASAELLNERAAAPASLSTGRLEGLVQEVRMQAWDDSGLCLNPDLDELADQLEAVLKDLPVDRNFTCPKCGAEFEDDGKEHPHGILCPSCKGPLKGVINPGPLATAEKSALKDSDNPFNALKNTPNVFAPPSKKRLERLLDEGPVTTEQPSPAKEKQL
jgi:hypothetical protein